MALQGTEARQSAALERQLFPAFRDWLVQHQWRIEAPVGANEMLRATKPVAGGRSVKTIFAYNGPDQDNLLLFDDAAAQVQAFKAELKMQRMGDRHGQI